MRTNRALTGMAMLAATCLLGGCVAALVPVAAGVMVADSQMDKSAGAAAPDVSIAQASLPPPVAEVQSQAEAPLAQESLTLTNLTALPRPGPGDFPLGQEVTIQRFADYAIRQSSSEPTAPSTGTPLPSAARRDPRKSALLKEPASLNTARAACGGKPPAVIIDLDPRGDTFDPLSQPEPALTLGGELARLRDAGIAVFWSTNLAENFVPDLRSTLADAGLDPDGTDRVLALASLKDRKQTRREEVAATHCPIAILGDEKADFDELYEYLRNPENPVAPDALVGAGWFLATPFIANPKAAQ